MESTFDLYCGRFLESDFILGLMLTARFETPLFCLGDS